MTELHERLAKAKQIIHTLEDELRHADRGLIALTSELEARAAALEESERRFRLMIEGSEEVFFYTHDDEGRFTYLSPSVQQVLGYSVDELIGRPYGVLLTGAPEDREVDERTEAALTSGRKGEPYLARARHRGGREVCLELVEQPLDMGGRTGMQGFARDVTERKRRQDALRETTRIMNALIEASPAAIYVLDREGRVGLWNPAAERLFGWTAVEVIGEKLPAPGDHTELESLLRRTLEGQAFSAMDVRRARKDGTVIDINVSTAPLSSGTGEIDGIVAVAVDVSEKKALEEQLLRAQKMEAIGRLAGGVAHDFNNILTAIKGHADFALDHLPDGSAALDEVIEVRRNADRAADLTRQLLAFSRQQVVQPKVVDLAAEVREMEKMVRRIIGEDVEFHTRLAEGRVRMDPSQLHQVILNLVVNARDAMPNGGRIEVVIEPVTVEKEAPATAAPGPGDYMRLSIRDDGEGMEAATQEHIFEPFFTTKDLGKGTGLGLATVYGIVSNGGGGIEVASERGVGTTFDVYLPRVDEPVATADRAAAAPAASPADTPSGRTILVIEDETSVRNLVTRVLKRQGYAVIDVGGGEEATQLDEETLAGIDLVLSDVVMPDMSGRELVRCLRKRRPDLTVMFMSGYTRDEAVRRGIGSEDFSFIEKPFSPAELVGRVQEVLRGA